MYNFNHNNQTLFNTKSSIHFYKLIINYFRLINKPEQNLYI